LYFVRGQEFDVDGIVMPGSMTIPPSVTGCNAQHLTSGVLRQNQRHWREQGRNVSRRGFEELAWRSN
jgi:hypothetical protein